MLITNKSTKTISPEEAVECIMDVVEAIVVMDGDEFCDVRILTVSNTPKFSYYTAAFTPLVVMSSEPWFSAKCTSMKEAVRKCIDSAMGDGQRLHFFDDIEEFTKWLKTR